MVGGPGPDVIVVGGGVVGLSVGWRLAARGVATTVLDPSPGAGASRAAAGLLAPVTEVHYGEERLLELTLAAARGYPAFVGELAAASGQDPGYRRCGTLAVAADGGDGALLEDLHRFQQRLGLPVSLLSVREARQLEPLLAPGLRRVLWIPDDHQVDNRQLVAALLAALDRARVPLRRQSATRLLVQAGRAAGVLLADGSRLTAPVVVLAAGAWSTGLAGLPSDAVPPVRPVKGQILRLRMDPSQPVLTHNLRAVVAGHSVYLVPRESGELVVGATVEELGFDTTVRAAAVHDLLRDALRVLPAVGELQLVETLAGLRPGTPDNAPVVGWSALPGLLLATGHYRNGVLLAGVTAEAVAELVGTGQLTGPLAGFSPNRFTATPVSA